MSEVTLITLRSQVTVRTKTYVEDTDTFKVVLTDDLDPTQATVLLVLDLPPGEAEAFEIGQSVPSQTFMEVPYEALSN